MKSFGFSLIELLVVITVIGLLTAIAVPAYQRYSLTAKLSKSATVVMSLVQQSISYSAMHGVFPTAYQLGYSTSVGSSSMDDAIAQHIMPYYVGNANGGYVGMDDEGGASACGAKGLVVAYLDPIALGLGSSYSSVTQNGNGVSLAVYIMHYNGAIYTNMQYHICTSAGVCQTQGQSTFLPPPWYNSGNSYNTIVPATVALQTAYTNATCQ